MDFANERYVRLYVRDTITWKRLGWDGQNVLTQLLRKADRSGVIDLGGVEPWEVPVVLCGAPEDQARRGMARILELECAVQDGDRLVFPRYIEANECAQSDAQRQRESRAKRGAISNYPPPKPVTKRDDRQSQNVTECHELSQDVTDGHNLSLRAVPCRALPADPEEESTHAHARDRWSDSGRAQRIVLEFQKRYETATLAVPNQGQLSKAAATLLPVLERTATLRGVTFENALERLLGGFFASDRARAKGFPPAFLAANPLEYFDPQESQVTQKTPTQRIGIAEAACNAAEQAYRRNPNESTMKAWNVACSQLGQLKEDLKWTA